MSNPSSDLNAVIMQLAELNIAAVAETLGMQVFTKVTGEAKSLCPFHSDTQPSLVLYGTGRPHYHCYVCGAHGDVFDLVKHKRSMEFMDAARWLADWAHIPWPHSYISPGINAWREAARIYAKSTALKSFAKWAAGRGYTVEFLRDAGVGFTTGNKLTACAGGVEGRRLLDAFGAASLVRYGRGNTSKEAEDSGSLSIDDVYDYFWGKRAVFGIADPDGHLVGFAGRAIDDAKPKYLYTKGLPKSKVLYRYDNASKCAMASEPRANGCVDVFVTEGLLDALRFESLGLAAVAILGARASKAQVGLLLELARKCESKNRILAVHVFLDADPAGNTGARALLADLLREAVTKDIQIYADVVVLQDASGVPLAGGDPDSFLRDSSCTEAINEVARVTTPVITFLVASICGWHPEKLRDLWPALSSIEQQSALRRLELLLGGYASAHAISERFAIAAASIGTEDAEHTEWMLAFRRRATNRSREAQPETKEGSAVSLSPHLSEAASLRHAMNVARTSSQRRELPTDSNGWHQLDLAADIALPYLARLLKDAKGARLGSPMLSYPVPRLDGEYRLKVSPSNEVLLLQQYLVNELIASRDDLPESLERIPAVRRWAGEKAVETTGVGCPVETVSFAYQIDMDVVEGRRPPRSSGMFVHYYDCWHSFVNYVDQLVTRVTSDSGYVYMARLDIRRYYDNVPRHAIHDALREPCRELFSLAADMGVGRLAPLWCPSEGDEKKRADQLVDWLCDSSFGYEYESYADAKRIRSDLSRGLPQGPDLSAYLANIALFKMDKAVSDAARQLVDRPDPIAGYARYVDDLVIVATEREHIAHLTSVIESHLQTLGLELNRKHQPLPRMTEAEAREWVTEQRGGLGASVLGEMPFVAGDATLAFIDASQPTDRREALAMLANPELFDVDLSSDDVEKLLETVGNTPDLRYGDMVRVCTVIWFTLARDTTVDQQQMADLFFSQFKNIIHTTPPPDSLASRQYDANTRLLAALEGLERVLCSRRDRAPGFSSEAKEKMAETRETLATWVLAEDSMSGLKGTAVSAGGYKDIAYAANLRQLNIVREAIVISGDTRAKHLDEVLDLLVSAGPSSLPYAAQLRHLAALDCKGALTRISSQPDTDVVQIMHECIARLRSTKESSQSDPLAPIAKVIEEAQHKVPEGDVGRELLLQLLYWLPDRKPDQGTDDWKHAACRTFLNCVPRARIGDLLSSRAAMGADLLGKGVVPIPIPPGTSFPGIVGQHADSFVRIDFRSDAVFAGGWAWENGDKSELTDLYAKQHVDRDGWTVLEPAARAYTPGDCVTAARLVRKLWGHMSTSIDESKTVLPFLGNMVQIGEGVSNPPKLLTYLVSRQEVGSSAFVRTPGNGLVSREVPSEAADAWRLGVAVADYFGLGQEGLCDEDIRLTAKSLVGDEDSWVSETMLRLAFARLTGRSIGIRPPKRDGLHALPRTVERMLVCMETFGKEDTNIEAQMSALCAALVDMRASSLRLGREYESIELPGLTGSLLSTLALSFFKHDEVFGEHLPFSKQTTTSVLESVTGQLWWGIGARVEELQVCTGHESPEMELLAIGCKLRALVSEFRAISIAFSTHLSMPAREAIREAVRASSIADRDLDLSGFCLVLGRDSDSGLEGIIESLFSGTDNSLMSQITPLGWAVTACLLGGVIGDLPGYIGSRIQTVDLATGDSCDNPCDLGLAQE